MYNYMHKDTQGVAEAVKLPYKWLAMATTMLSSDVATIL